MSIRILIAGLAVIGLCEFLYEEAARTGNEDEELRKFGIPVFSATLVILVYVLFFAGRVPEEDRKHVRAAGPTAFCVFVAIVLSIVASIVLFELELQEHWLRYAVPAAIMAMASIAAHEWTFLDYRIRKERGELE